MNDYPVFLNFIFAMCGCFGFCLVNNMQWKHILFASIGGGVSWSVFFVMTQYKETSPVAAYFMGACAVALLAEVFSRAGKEATTLFIIPGIIPMVPGATMLQTVLDIILGNYGNAAANAVSVLFTAISISIALLATATFTRVIIAVKNRIVHGL